MPKSKPPKPLLEPPFSYYGGKRYMLKHLLPLLPKHHQYVEPYFGSGRLFFAKEPALVETINDLDAGVIGFFRALRDDPVEMERLASLTPWSREFYAECKGTWQQEEDPTRRAWKWWVVAEQSRNGNWGSSWMFSVTTSTCNMAKTCGRAVAYRGRMRAIAQRLMATQIECGPARRVIEAHARPDTLFYLDPPYELGTRIGGKRYAHEMTAADHAELVANIALMDARFIVSGYACPTYTALEDAGWTRLDFKVLAFSCRAARTHGHNGKPDEPERIESVWLDPRTAAEVLPAAQGTLPLVEAAG